MAVSSPWKIAPFTYNPIDTSDDVAVFFFVLTERCAELFSKNFTHLFRTMAKNNSKK